ncbi:MAG: pyrroline-5-carboxylate reductase [Alphaproteobacteria bacterium]|nr:pyrroline-5-carboxylate reductase [Alphaproteobacteria bacterium]
MAAADPRLTRPLLLVGCGRMGGAMLSGWLESGIAGAGVAVVDPLGAPDFADSKQVKVYGSMDALPGDLDPEVVVFAVKPQQMDEAAPAAARFAGPDTVFLSIAAGKPIRYFAGHLGPDAAIVRAMPNTPAAIGQGITVACPSAAVPEAQFAICTSLLAAVGEVLPVDDEALIDPVTAVSGSGPAYVFLLIECLGEAGVEAGLPRDLAARLALVTVAGAGQLALRGDDAPAQLRKNVSSPGGTTQAALDILMAKNGLQPLMTRAVAAATRRGRELAD